MVRVWNMPHGIPMMNSAPMSIGMLCAKTAKKIVPIMKIMPQKKVRFAPYRSWQNPVTTSPTSCPQVAMLPRAPWVEAGMMSLPFCMTPNRARNCGRPKNELTWAWRRQLTSTPRSRTQNSRTQQQNAEQRQHVYYAESLQVMTPLTTAVSYPSILHCSQHESPARTQVYAPHPPQRRGDEQRPYRRAPMVPPRLGERLPLLPLDHLVAQPEEVVVDLDVGEDLGVGDVDDGVGGLVLLVDGHGGAVVRAAMCCF